MQGRVKEEGSDSRVGVLQTRVCLIPSVCTQQLILAPSLHLFVSELE